MVLNIPGRGPLTEEQSRFLFFMTFKDDMEDAPWMVMGSLQWDAAVLFHQSVREYAQRNQLPWFVAGMLPILFRWPGIHEKHQVAPDVFVAFTNDRPRSSFDLEVEGPMPPFVLEVVSPSSTLRDRETKRQAYEYLGVQEYALFTPSARGESTLDGYRRGEAGEFTSWSKDERGWLWSEVLGLYLVPQGEVVRAASGDGQLIPTLRESVLAQERVTAELQSTEAEVERLRQEIERLRRATDKG
jgi:Uma2 family endonuclease